MVYELAVSFGEKTFLFCSLVSLVYICVTTVPEPRVLLVIYDLLCIHLYLYQLQYVTNSQRDQLPDGLIAQLVEQEGHGFEYRSSLNQFFQAIISRLFKLCV